jgi:F-type H+-transporting ATPase subunit b
VNLLHNPEFWVAVAFFLLIALFIYLKAPAKVINLLDERAAGIAKTLADAQKLREEAQALLGEYRGKRQQAEAEAAAVKDVRAATAELAVSVATRILKEELKGPQGAKLIDRSIADLRDKLV